MNVSKLRAYIYYCCKFNRSINLSVTSSQVMHNMINQRSIEMYISTNQNKLNRVRFCKIQILFIKKIKV